MKSRQLIAAAFLCLALTGTAGASIKRTTLGALSNADFGVVGTDLSFAQSFQDAVHLAVASTSTVGGLVTPIRQINATWRLSNAAGTLTGGALTVGRNTFADLAPGSYALSMFGTANYLSGYGATYHVSVAAVPEMETWTMLAIGLVLAAYQLHRKQKALGQQVLNDEALSSA